MVRNKILKFKIDIRDLKRGYPNAQPVFRGDIKEKGFIYVTGENIYVAENKAQEIYDKMPKKYGKKMNGTTSSIRKKGRHNI